MHKNNQKYNYPYMINFQQALDLIADNSVLKETEIVSNKKLLGRITSQNVNAPISVPQFSNSAMDGYAVNALDLEKAGIDDPVELKLLGLTAAGENQQRQNDTQTTTPRLGTAWKIMTGAPVPQGYDSIIPVENTELQNGELKCFNPVKKGQHIRHIGEDFNQGENIIPAKEFINNNKAMGLDTLGVKELQVYKKLKISVLSTGKELVDDPSQELKPGQIRNTNKPYMLNWLKQVPAEVFDLGTNLDDKTAYINSISQEIEKNVDIIISTGAVSMGDFDFIPSCIEQLGGKIIFHKVKIRPGKPILFARFPNGTLYFGLPGNPISCAVGLRFFVSIAIRKMFGLKKEKPNNALVKEGFQKKLGFLGILKAYASLNDEAQLIATILKGQESFKIKPMIESNGWVIGNEDRDVISSEEKVCFYSSDICFHSYLS